jgi:hypothetical protein
MMPATIKTAQFTILALVFAIVSVRAEDWTVSGKDYHNVVVGQVEADRVHISYDGGVGAVNLADLPPDLQRRFNYDPEKAKKVSEVRAQLEAQIALQQRSALEEAAEYKKQRAAYDAEVARIEDINQKNHEYNVHGGAFHAEIYPIPEFKFRPQVDLTKPQDTACRVFQVLGDGFITNNLICGFGAYDLAFIKCDTKGMIDGQQWHGPMIPFNTYSSTTALGATST